MPARHQTSNGPTAERRTDGLLHLQLLEHMFESSSSLTVWFISSGDDCARSAMEHLRGSSYASDLTHDCSDRSSHQSDPRPLDLVDMAVPRLLTWDLHLHPRHCPLAEWAGKAELQRH